MKVMGEITEVPMIFNFQASEDEMTKRILERSKTSGRSDDNIESLKKRFRTFENDSKPIIDLYRSKGLCVDLNAMDTIDGVYAEFKKALAPYF